MADQDSHAMYAEYEMLKGVEQRKNILIEVKCFHVIGTPAADNEKELLRRYDQLSEAFEREQLDHARESQFNRDVQLREQRLQKELRGYKDDMVGYHGVYRIECPGWDHLCW